MNDRRSITALILYIVGGTAVVVSLFMLSAPTVESYAPGLVALLLGVAILGIGRACAHLSRIRDILEGRR